MLYDSLLVFALWMATVFILVAINGGEAVQGWWLTPLLLAVLGSYYIYCWQRSGQTLGMRAWRLQLVDESGMPVSIKAACLRFIAAFPSVLIAGLGYVWFYFGNRKQPCHDRLSKTYVVLLPEEN